MYNIGDIISISFLGQRYDNCEIVDIDLHGGNKNNCILKAKTPNGRIIPFIGMTKEQEKWAFVIKDETEQITNNSDEK